MSDCQRLQWEPYRYFVLAVRWYCCRFLCKIIAVHFESIKTSQWLYQLKYCTHFKLCIFGLGLHSSYVAAHNFHKWNTYQCQSLPFYISFFKLAMKIGMKEVGSVFNCGDT